MVEAVPTEREKASAAPSLPPTEPSRLKRVFCSSSSSGSVSGEAAVKPPAARRIIDDDNEDREERPRVLLSDEMSLAERLAVLKGKKEGKERAAETSPAPRKKAGAEAKGTRKGPATGSNTSARGRTGAQGMSNGVSVAEKGAKRPKTVPLSTTKERSGSVGRKGAEAPGREAKRGTERKQPATTQAVTKGRPVGAVVQKVVKLAVKADPVRKKDAVSETTRETGTGEEDEDEFKWWENGEGPLEWDDTVKWGSLEHRGPYFPPPYVPHGVPLVYKGEPLRLEPEAEEVASFFAALVGTDYGRNPIFRANFFADFVAVLQECGSRHRGTIQRLEDCHFAKMAAHFETLREARKALTKEERARLKAEKLALEAEYGHCLLDGRRERVGNFRIEPPGLFRGRGAHPKAGKLKRRVLPEQVTINIGEDARVPEPPLGHRWRAVQHDRTVTWLATWTENINRNQKYVFLAAGSSLKGQSDLRKFETARQLAKHVGAIRTQNAQDLVDKDVLVRQRATALWLIDHLALRAGNEKGDDEADTVGCCSLRVEHVRFEGTGTLVLDFLGKDSIRYHRSVEVDAVIIRNLKDFCRPPKRAADLIFDRLNTSTLNKWLAGLMPGLTAKVFRTYNASHTFQRALDEDTGAVVLVTEKVLAYNRANRVVAVLCNHQRAVPKTHAQSMERLRDRLQDLKYQRWRARRELKRAGGRVPALLDSDVEEEYRRGKEKEEAVSATGDKTASPRKPEVLAKRLAALNERIAATRLQLTDRDENKATALGTSKTNYIDPRITAAWCRKHGVPIEKLFNASLREKFKWAMSVTETWSFGRAD